VIDLASYYTKRINEADINNKEKEIKEAILRLKKMTSNDYSSEIANNDFKEVLKKKLSTSPIFLKILSISSFILKTKQ